MVPAMTLTYQFYRVHGGDDRISFIATHPKTLIFEQGYIIGIPFDNVVNSMIDTLGSFSVEMTIKRIVNLDAFKTLPSYLNIRPAPSHATIDVCD